MYIRCMNKYQKQIKIANQEKNLADGKIPCAKCGKETTVYKAWFDPYLGGGVYVHYQCLSAKRLKEADLEMVKE